jgi:hypothetical protein
MLSSLPGNRRILDRLPFIENLRAESQKSGLSLPNQRSYHVYRISRGPHYKRGTGRQRLSVWLIVQVPDLENINRAVSLEASHERVPNHRDLVFEGGGGAETFCNASRGTGQTRLAAFWTRLKPRGRLGCLTAGQEDGDGDGFSRDGETCGGQAGDRKRRRRGEVSQKVGAGRCGQGRKE